MSGLIARNRLKAYSLTALQRGVPPTPLLSGVFLINGMNSWPPSL